jgi:hypothetical protein
MLVVLALVVILVAGKFIASIIMLIGYGIIAVPTGIITTEIALMGKSVTYLKDIRIDTRLQFKPYSVPI